MCPASLAAKNLVKTRTARRGARLFQSMTRPMAAVTVACAALMAAALLLDSEKIQSRSHGGRSRTRRRRQALTLAPNLSFVDDSSDNFPIRGENLEEGKIALDRPTAIFFGTALCWNTNREAERFVAVSARSGRASGSSSWTSGAPPRSRRPWSRASTGTPSQRSRCWTATEGSSTTRREKRRASSATPPRSKRSSREPRTLDSPAPAERSQPA